MEPRPAWATCASSRQISAKVEFDGTFLVGHRAIASSRLGEGRYQVRFNREVPNCTMAATSRNRLAVVSIDRDPLNARAVTVKTHSLANDAGGTLFKASDSAFDLWGVC